MFIECVLGKRHRRICRRWQDVLKACRPYDVRSMAAAGPLRVIRVDGPTADGIERVLDTACLIERVRMDGRLDIIGIRYAQAGIDDGWRRAPVFVDLEAHRACLNLLSKRWQT